MSCNNKCGFRACSCIGILIGIVFAAVVGLLFAFTSIPFLTTAVWIAFGLGALTLVSTIAGIFLGAVTAPNALSRCFCEHTSCLLAGSMGTILAALVSLAITLSSASVFAIVLVAITAFFFALTFLALISLIRCIACRMCTERSE